MTATYSVNGKPISFEELKNIQIVKKDYIDYVENIKKTVNRHIHNDFDKIQK